MIDRTPHVVFEVGGLGRLAPYLAASGARRLLVVTTPARRHLEAVLAAASGFEVSVFDGARVHVPAAVVEEARAALAGAGADTVVTLGGGAATGLGKILRQAYGVRLVAIPTTYAGSEMTSIFGTTAGGRKRTGRDESVRPELVIYAPELVATVPLGVAVQSLMNALAHPVSALSTGALASGAAAGALAATHDLVAAIGHLIEQPDSLSACARALAAASAAAGVLDGSPMGVHHRAAHWLGGRFDLGHAALHAVLLPASLASLRHERPALAASLDEAAGTERLEAYVHECLVRVSVPTSLEALGITAAALREALAGDPEPPAELIRAAHRGADGGDR